MTYLYYLCCTCIDLYYLSSWGGCWFIVFIRFIYNFLNVCPFDYMAVAEVGRSGRKPVIHTNWVAVVTPTDRYEVGPQPLCNWTFYAVFCVVTLPFWHFCWCREFCHRTESDLFLFSPLPACRGPISLSVCLSVRHISVFRTFLCCLSRYWLEI